MSSLVVMMSVGKSHLLLRRIEYFFRALCRNGVVLLCLLVKQCLKNCVIFCSALFEILKLSFCLLSLGFFFKAMSETQIILSIF